MIQKITNLIFEGLHLKRIKHEGWRFCGVDRPDSVAEHSLNAAQIGYIIAKMEGADANKVAAMLVWHDLGEARVGDHHRIASHYIPERTQAEDRAFKDAVGNLEFGDDIYDLFSQYENRSTLEGQIAKDADYLEQAFQGKIYVETGHQLAQSWIDNVGLALQTKSAQLIHKQLTQSTSTQWIEEIRNFNRK